MSFDSQTDIKNEQNEQRVNIFAVAVRSAFWTVVAGVLLCACFLSFFPYTAMKFYAKLDLKEMAFASAEKYIARNASDYSAESGRVPSGFGKYADALYYAANASIYFLNDAVSEKGGASEDAVYYAKKVNKYANEYIYWNDLSLLGEENSFRNRTKKIDDYNLLHTAPRMRPHVYSYTDYLNTALFKSWYVLAKDEKARSVETSAYLEKMTTRLSTVTTRWNEIEDWTKENENTVADVFLLFGQLSTYIDAELYELGLYKDIAANPNGLLHIDENEIGNFSRRALLSGKDKPFDLFLEDDVRNAGNGKESIFTVWYDFINDNYSKFVELVKSLTMNGNKYIPSSAEATADVTHAATQQLKYTYYVKTLSDFSRSMHNMTAVFSGNRRYFDEKVQTDLQQSFEDWQNNMFVGDVRNSANLSSCRIFEWYEWGMLNDYLSYFRAPANA